MPAVAVVGAQWGDEGKGKVVDILSEHADIVVRFQGGNNAGHTLVVGEETTIVHLIPSGRAPGQGLRHRQRGRGRSLGADRGARPTAGARFTWPTTTTSRSATELTSYCPTTGRSMSRARTMRGGAAIGTTGRGIGPTYEDKMARDGIRFADLLDEDAFPDMLREVGRTQESLSDAELLGVRVRFRLRRGARGM